MSGWGIMIIVVILATILFALIGIDNHIQQIAHLIQGPAK
jgi:YbbR domain-containing protein